MIYIEVVAEMFLVDAALDHTSDLRADLFRGEGLVEWGGSAAAHQREKELSVLFDESIASLDDAGQRGPSVVDLGGAIELAQDGLAEFVGDSLSEGVFAGEVTIEGADADAGIIG